MQRLRALPLLLVLACASSPPAAESAPKSDAPDSGAVTKPAAKSGSLLKAVEDRYTKAGTVSAQFRQTVLSAVTKTEKTSEGVLELSYPGRVRWEVTKPDPEVLVSDGKTLWHYTPPFDPADKSDKGQAIKRDATKLGSQWLETILAGRFSKLKGVTVKAAKARVFELLPSAGAKEDLVRAEIRLGENSDVIENVVIQFKSGNRTEVALSQVELGRTLGPARFEFKPPPGTEILSGK